MVKKADIWKCQGDVSANQEFLLEYQKAVLCALQASEILTCEQQAESTILLENQYH